MNGIRQRGKELFSQRFGQIERAARAVAAQHRLSQDESQELYSLVMLKVVQDNFRVLRRFQGKSRWSTYLTVIVQRVLLDHRVKEWGRWRPSARSRRLGVTAIQLDQLINRDGLESAEAIRFILTQGVDETAGELEQLAQRIPRRPRRRFLSGDRCLRIPADSEAADQRIETAEHHRTIAHLNIALVSALRDLSVHERDLICMRFGRGWTVRRIAASQKLEARSLYRRFECILRQLRRNLERTGIVWNDVVEALEGHDMDLKLSLQ